MGVETIKHSEQTIGMIIRSSHDGEGIEFFTPDSFSQQLAYMKRPRGYVVEPHVHNPVRRDIVWTQEVLFVKSGVMRVDFFTAGGHYLESRIVRAGDVLLLAAGGHGFEMMETTELIEVKQGPFCGVQDKTRFGGISADRVRIPDEAGAAAEGPTRS